MESTGRVSQPSPVQTQCLVLQLLPEAGPLHPPLHHHLPPHQSSLPGDQSPHVHLDNISPPSSPDCQTVKTDRQTDRGTGARQPRTGAA